MTPPTIHANGTSRTQLVSDLCEASVALAAAHKALVQTAPNGRDYYPQGPKAMAAATREHTVRLRAVEAVMAEVDAMAFAISQS